jgi:exopolysaccharide production protein ExoY
VVSACERAASAGLLLLALPFTAAGAAAMAIASRRGPLIAHKRVGWHGETLWMLKVRTMWENAPPERAAAGAIARPTKFRWVEYIDDEAGPEEKREEDPRVGNRVAGFLRRHSVDEIPQLWHVIRGEMSLVGPRPLTASELRRYYGAAAEETLQLKPGIAGLWQTSGRARLSHEERRELDLQYVRERSVRMYLAISWKAVREVITGENTW